MRPCNIRSCSEEELETILVFALHLRRKRKRGNRRSMWVRPLFARRQQQGEYHNLLQEMRLSDPDSHFRYLRMSRERFDALLAKVSSPLTRRSYYSSTRARIEPAERLAIALHYLATGNSQISLSFNFQMGRSTVCSILKETCKAIWTALKDEFVRVPSCEADWVGINKQFEQLWNFPNCIGAIDGKHITIQAPFNADSTFFNYKGTHSIVLVAVCDAHYRFILLDLGEAGCHSDGGVFVNSEFGQAFENGAFSIPNPRPLTGTTEPALPYVIVGDAAFPLKENMLRPYPGKNLPEDKAILNYRLSRACRIIENTFGILAARWRVFRKPIVSDPDKVILYTKAAIALHNYLRTTESTIYCPPGFIDVEDGNGSIVYGSWRQNEDPCASLEPLRNVGSNRHSRSAARIRDAYKNFFNSPVGEVSWLYNRVQRT